MVCDVVMSLCCLVLSSVGVSESRCFVISAFPSFLFLFSIFLASSYTSTTCLLHVTFSRLDTEKERKKESVGFDLDVV
jgi:hypothetical protein